MCSPFEPVVFTTRRHLQHIQRLPHDEPGFAHAFERRPGAGIQIEVQVVGTVDIVGRRVPLVQVDAAEVDDPQQRRQILDHREVDDVPGAVIDRAGSIHAGRGDGARFMKKKGPAAPCG